jgi:hypothetical protein
MALTITAGPECLGQNFSCNASIPTCHNSAGFDFPTLWKITHQYWQKCHDGPWLFKQQGIAGDVLEGKAAFTLSACEIIAGAGWKRYLNADIWYRLTTWKFPLFQLIFISPRPPLGFWEEAFSIVHLLGDPVGSSTDLIRKIDSCQERARFWKDALTCPGLELVLDDHDEPRRHYQQRLWKALALISVSYDEWGSEKGTIAQDYLQRTL